VLANNPLSQALADLAKEYYKKDGVEINIAILPENDMREKLTTEASSGATRMTCSTLGLTRRRTGPATAGSKTDPYFEAMTEEQKAWYDYDDLIPGMMQSLALDGKQYAIPYYGESSFSCTTRNSSRRPA
jgi:sorbitol/mannitol transport system substrate-binding protein